MLYNMFFGEMVLYLYRKKRKNKPFSTTGGEHQIAKYRAMGNGPMCQELTALLQKKLATAVA